jgi:hypothetical protein
VSAPRDPEVGEPLTQKRLRELLSYDAATGIFVWLIPPWNHPRMRGKIAGCGSTGYTLIRIGGRKYKAHRLAWLYVIGVWPSKRLDHRDGDPFNNAWLNLREATPAQNCANCCRVRGKDLPKGVRRSRGRYSARITFDKKQIALGGYATIEEAADAYLAAAKRLYGEFARAA